MQKFDAKLIDGLEQLGLGEKEAKVYLAAVEQGPTTISKLAKKSGVKRTTVHEFIDEMIARGLIVSSVSGKRNLYGPLEPEGLEKILDRQREIISEIVPELILLGKGSAKKPRIRLYEGVEGVEFAFMDALKAVGSSYVNFSNFGEAYKVVSPGFFKKWTAVKIKNQVHSRTILPSDEYSIMHTNENKKELRESIFVSREDFSAATENLICEDKAIFISLGEEKFAVIIESPQIVKTQKMIFDLAWKNLKELERLRKKK
jgi:HTH-type transcriptional regulator, sugar sensing transcriptional regulator